MQKILLAVSGGVDSMALLHMKKDYHVEVAHVNHQIRDDSTLDEQLVINYCKSLGIPVHIKRLNNIPMSGLEAWARSQRYQFFNELIEQYQFDTLMTAHHAQDQAETVIMRIMRGTGIKGLRGILSNTKIERPLINMYKYELYNYCNSHHIPYREDYTNHDTHYRRNHIRHNILQMQDVPMLCNIAKLANNAFINALSITSKHWNKYITISDTRITISKSLPLNDLSYLFLNEILWFPLTNRIFTLIKDERVNHFMISGNFSCSKTTDYIIFNKN